MISTTYSPARLLVAVSTAAVLMLSGCGSSDDTPTTTVDAPVTTSGLDDGAGTELEPGSNLPPDETPSISGAPNDATIDGTPGPNDEGVPDAGSTVSVAD